MGYQWVLGFLPIVCYGEGHTNSHASCISGAHFGSLRFVLMFYIWAKVRPF